MKIGVTDRMGTEAKYQAYCDWLTFGFTDIEIVRLSYKHGNVASVRECDGILLTGGGDVDPRLYGGDPEHPNIYGVDTRRDDFERTVIDSTIRSRIPLMGICRGMQLTNVHLGGTLVPDLPEAGFQGHASDGEPDPRHGILLQPGSNPDGFAAGPGVVNSSHHQAVDIPAPGLVVTARAADGVIEMMEPGPGSLPSFLLLVQWHPERMNETANPFCETVRERFFQAIQSHQKTK